MQFYATLRLGDWIRTRQAVLSWFQDKHTKVGANSTLQLHSRYIYGEIFAKKVSLTSS